MSTTNETTIEETLVDVIRMVARLFDGKYHVAIGSDDGGKAIEVRIEMKDTSAPLLREHPKFPIQQLRALPGRTILLKVPLGCRKKSS
jgi:hypothetical protein|tara:strand:+ start:462 stop:725 length:264 start_codon:yes stop_codon:yes gene_type:complete